MPRPQAHLPTDAQALTADMIETASRAKTLGRAVYAFQECASTNLVARRLIEARATGKPGPPNGALVVSDFQRGGRGRNGRSWNATPGASLLLSLILYPAERGADSKVDLAHLVTMAAALAAATALDTEGAQGCSIKWPNDLLAPDGRKVCGILTERLTTPDAPSALIVGVGINVAHKREDFPPELAQIASSARIVADKDVSRLALLVRFLEDMEERLAQSKEAIFEAWRLRCSTLGRTVRARLADRAITGHALGVESDGALLIQLDSGERLAVRAGDVEELRAKEAPPK